jgi:hypothetical protein
MTSIYGVVDMILMYFLRCIYNIISIKIKKKSKKKAPNIKFVSKFFILLEQRNYRWRLND